MVWMELSMECISVRSLCFTINKLIAHKTRYRVLTDTMFSLEGDSTVFIDNFSINLLAYCNPLLDICQLFQYAYIGRDLLESRSFVQSRCVISRSLVCLAEGRTMLQVRDIMNSKTLAINNVQFRNMSFTPHTQFKTNRSSP